MGKYLYQISDAGQILCRFADDAGEEDGLRMDGYKAINEFSLEEKVNATFIASAAAGELLESHDTLILAMDDRLETEISRLGQVIDGVQNEVSDLEDEINYVKRRM